MKILVTGGAGFIGSFLVDDFIGKSHSVRIFDNLDPQVHPDGNLPDYLNHDAEFIKGDLRDIDALQKALDDVEVICHMAGAVGVGQSQYEIARYVESNIQGTANLLDLLANKPHRVEKLIVAASMSSYGEGVYLCPEHGEVRPPLRETDQMEKRDWELHCPVCDDYVKPAPTSEDAALISNNVYALSKRVKEELCLMLGKLYGIPTTALRFFNVYGPRQSLSNPYTGVAAIFMSRIKNGKPPIVFEDGRQTRDFISVHDVVRAIGMCIGKPEADYKVFNLGSSKPVEIAEVARVIARLFEADIEPDIRNKFRKGDVRHCYADMSKIRDALGFETQVPFEDGMRELIDWAHTAHAEDRVDQAIRELEEKKLV